MSQIREFVFSILVISVSGAAVTMFLPENSKTVKYVHFLVGIIVTSVLLMPLGRMKGILPELITKDIEFDIKETEISAYTSALADEAINNIEKSVSDRIYERFDIRPLRVEVDCNYDIENLLINRVDIYFDVKNKLLYSDTVNFTEGIFEGSCEVRVMYEDT